MRPSDWEAGEQPEVGTVVTGQEWSYCYAVVSILNTTRHQAAEALVEIRKFLQKHSPNETLRSKLDEVMTPQHSSLFIFILVFF